MNRKGRKKQGRNKSLAVSVACMAIYWPTPGFKGRTYKLCALNGLNFNFCVRSSPQRGQQKGDVPLPGNAVSPRTQLKASWPSHLISMCQTGKVWVESHLPHQFTVIGDEALSSCVPIVAVLRRRPKSMDRTVALRWKQIIFLSLSNWQRQCHSGNGSSLLTDWYQQNCRIGKKKKKKCASIPKYFAKRIQLCLPRKS